MRLCNYPPSPHSPSFILGLTKPWSRKKAKMSIIPFCCLCSISCSWTWPQIPSCIAPIVDHSSHQRVVLFFARLKWKLGEEYGGRDTHRKREKEAGGSREPGCGSHVTNKFVCIHGKPKKRRKKNQRPTSQSKGKMKREEKLVYLLPADLFLPWPWSWPSIPQSHFVNATGVRSRGGGFLPLWYFYALWSYFVRHVLVVHNRGL